MVTINIHKKDLFLISAVVVFLIGAGIVIATGSTPDINGHSYSEIQKCGDQQILKMSGGNWVCGGDNAGVGITISDIGEIKSNQDGDRNGEYSIWVGTGKTCYVSLKYAGGPCGSDLFECWWDSNTGRIQAKNGCGSADGWEVICGYICFK